MANIDLTKHSKPVRLAAHAIGLDHKKPYIRHGKTFYRPYRNYFTTRTKSYDHEIWCELFFYGYAAFSLPPNTMPGSTKFWLTRKGLDWLGETLNITIYDEED